MAFLVRKFNRAKWPGENELQLIEDLSADALTSCLRTSGNTLSVWKTGSAVWGTFDDILAALFSTLDGPNRADVIVISQREVELIDGVELIDVKASTAASESINNKHSDISKLSFSSMAKVAKIILTELANSDQETKFLQTELRQEKIKPEELELSDKIKVKRYSRKKVISIVTAFVNDSLIDPVKLSKKWQIELGIIDNVLPCDYCKRS
jgi:hypothetical protein